MNATIHSTAGELTLSRWTHPRTGEVRIYVNGLPRGAGRLHFARASANPAAAGGAYDFPLPRWSECTLSPARRDEIAAAVADAAGRSFDAMLGVAKA